MEGGQRTPRSREAAGRRAPTVRPPGDGDEWLSDIKAAVSPVMKIAAKFMRGDKSTGSSLSVRLTLSANVADNRVIPLRFNYHRTDPSTFT